MLTVTVYTRDQCHLCEALDAELTAYSQCSPIPFDIERIDIDAEPTLARRYGHKVPVVAIGTAQVCHFFLDEPALAAALHNRAGGGQ